MNQLGVMVAAAAILYACVRIPAIIRRVRGNRQSGASWDGRRR